MLNPVNRQQSTIAKTPSNPLDVLATVPTGLTLVVVKSKHLLPQVRVALTHQLLHASTATGLKFPTVNKLCSLYAGSDRQQQYAKANHAAAGAPPQDVEHQFKSFGKRSEYDWCSTEGLPPLLSLINTPDPAKTPCWYTLSQTITDSDSVMQADAFMQIRYAAQAAGVYVLAFLACDEGADETHFNDLCDEYLEIEECEPDMGHALAFSIDCYGLRDLNPLGIGKTLCNVSYEGVGVGVTYTYTPFIADDFKTRAMWILRGMGLHFAEIGDKVELNKSNVQRKLARLPPPRPVKMAEDWLDRLGDYLDAGIVKSTGNKTKDESDSTDEDYEEDDESP